MIFSIRNFYRYCFYSESLLYLNSGNPVGPNLTFIPGLYVGCYISDGLLRSTLEILFDQDEIDRLLRLLLNVTDTAMIERFPALNSTSLQTFAVKTTVNDLAARLFVDVWTKIISHEKYFLSCQPVECRYLFRGKRNFIVIITIVFGIIGGLNTILQLLAPFIIQIVFWIKGKYVHSNTDPPTVENSKLNYKIIVL
jgi:hypothetical protein